MRATVHTSAYTYTHACTRAYTRTRIHACRYTNTHTHADDAPVRVERDDRRFLLLETDDRYSGPQTPTITAYFDVLLAVDASAVAHFLYNRDLSGFNARSVPATKFGRALKVDFLPPVPAFLDDWIRSDMPSPNPWVSRSDAGTIIDRNLLFDLFTKFVSTDTASRSVRKATFFRTIEEVFGKLKETRNRVDGTLSSRQLVFPTVDESKRLFCSFVKDDGWFVQDA